VEVGLTSNRPLGIKVSTYLDDTKDPVTLDVRMGQLNDGTTYASDSTLDAKAKNLTVATSTNGLSEQVAEVRSLLDIPSQLDRVEVVFGTLNPDPGVLAIRTRSLMQIMSTLGAGVQIPQDHPCHGNAVPLDPALAPRGFTVHSGKEKPAEAFVAVP
jgi:hypothetical protein